MGMLKMMWIERRIERLVDAVMFAKSRCKWISHRGHREHGEKNSRNGNYD
jgi:hypothetical protein